MRILLTILGLFVLLTPTAAPGELAGVSAPGEPAGVVVSIAISSGILQPSEFPVAGRDCDTVLAELRGREGFAGTIRTTYEAPADSGRCFNLEGMQSRVAVVCCAPRTDP